MRLKIPKWIKWIVFIFYSLQLQSVIWSSVGTYGLYFLGRGYLGTYEISDILLFIFPVLPFLALAFFSDIQIAMFLVYGLFIVSEKFILSNSSNYYARYLAAMIVVYLGLVLYNNTFHPSSLEVTFSWIDDLQSSSSSDLWVFLTYFCGNFLFMLIYIPIWKWFQRWVNKFAIR